MFVLVGAMMVSHHAMAAEVANAPVATERAPARLARGGYRFEGQCTRMAVEAEDQTGECLGYAGIIASDLDHPAFVFPRSGRKVWVFNASGPGTMAVDGQAATYAIASTIDTSANQALAYPGECVHSVRVGEPLLHCILWKDGDRKAIVREVIFSGNGIWQFSRATG
ncbi:hypothetical protein ACXU4B_17565 [Dyella soli]